MGSLTELKNKGQRDTLRLSSVIFGFVQGELWVLTGHPDRAIYVETGWKSGEGDLVASL